MHTFLFIRLSMFYTVYPTQDQRESEVYPMGLGTQGEGHTERIAGQNYTHSFTHCILGYLLSLCLMM